MVRLTRLNGEKIFINIDLIELIEETPDTVITLTTGKKLVVKESVIKIQEAIIKLRKRTYTNLKA